MSKKIEKTKYLGDDVRESIQVQEYIKEELQDLKVNIKDNVVSEAKK